MTIIAAADGSALGNPGPAGWAWYVNDSCWRAGGWPHGTNNQGELMAVLDLLRQTAHVRHEELQILCDSQYVINSITKWMPGWKRKGWRKADGKPVLNVELLKDIDKALVGRKYTFTWVKGHAGHELNEAADDRARAVAFAYQQATSVPSGPGFAGSTAASRAAASTGAAAAATVLVPAAVLVEERNDERDDEQAYEEPALFGAADSTGGFMEQDEPDLFSTLEADQRPKLERSDEDVVLELERELLRADVRADLGRTGVLLHPDFTEIGSSGRFWTRDAMMMALEEDPGETRDLELLGADRIGENAMLLNYRTYARSGTSLRTSLWVLDGGHWRLRFHQGTPETL